MSSSHDDIGPTVLVENTEPGVWVIKTARSIPDSELWLHLPEASAQLDRALEAIRQPPSMKDLEGLETLPREQP